MDKGGNKSLLGWYGYNARKGTSEHTRRALLDNLISASFVPSNLNIEYISSFGPPDSKQRIKMIASVLEKQVGAQYYVKEGHNLWPSKQKKTSDAKWLRSKLEGM
jgi:hypothetical protein